jgi:hypothetical protein
MTHDPAWPDGTAALRTHRIHNLDCIKITGISREQHAGHVYDFTIPGDETFWAEGILVHNCGPCEQIDGYQYPSTEEANADYPGGGYVECEGLERCRGTIVVTWDQGAGSGGSQDEGTG